MEINKTMDDIDLLYDWYRDCNLAAGAYATLASRVKDDKIEQLFRDFTDWSLVAAKETSKMIITMGGKIY